MSRVLRIFFFLPAAFWFLASFADRIDASPQVSGSTRTINGSVVLQGSAVGNVRVMIESTTGSFHRTVYTDGAGSFGISGVPVGQCTFTLEAEGYQLTQDTVDVTPGSGILVVQFTMRPVVRVANPASKESSVSVTTLHIPPEAQSEFAAAQRDMQHQHWKEAKGHFEKALKRHAEFPQALRGLGLLELREQHLEQTLRLLSRAVALDPSYAEGQLLLSHVLNILGKHAQALDAAQKVVSLRPDVWQAQYELGVAALSLGQDEVALEASERIVSAAGPNIAETRLLRAGVLLKRLKYEEAKSELLAFLQLAGDHEFAPMARKTLAEVEEKISAKVR
jgi:tetratricopeptide (TPR) repeat protein